MNRLDAALARLRSALDAIETRLAARLDEGGLHEGAGEGVLAGLKADRDRLAARVASLEEDSQYLAGLTEEVENRLDGAISEIREALSRN